MPVFVTVPEVEWACGCRTVADQLVAVCIVALRREPTVAPAVERVLVRLAPTCYRLDQEAVAAAVAAAVTVSPNTVTLIENTTQQFTATVVNTSNQVVTWSATQGTINAAGLYTAPSVTQPETATVTATSGADPSATGQATVTVNPG